MHKKAEIVANFQWEELTSTSFFNFLGSFGCSTCSFFLFLLCSTSVKVFHHHTDKHVEHKEANQKEEGYKVD